MRTHASQTPWEYLSVCSDAGVHKTLTSAIHAFAGTANFSSGITSAMAYTTRRKLDGIFIDMGVEGRRNLLGSVRRGNSNRFSVVFACAGENEDTSLLLKAGANFVVHKPLDPQEIARVLESASQMMAGERQRYLRYPLALPVVLKTSDGEQKAITSNISRGGMAVRCLQSLEAGSPINFVLQLPLGEPLRGRGEVAWANTDGLMGIKFYLMGDEVKKNLWRWMEQRTG